MAKVIEAKDPHAAWATMSGQTLAGIFLSGVLVGTITYVLFMLLERFVFDPILCRDAVALARCESKENFASGVAIVIGSMLGLILLVRERVYRPILAIIGVAVSVWGLFSLVVGLPWFVGLIIVMLVMGLAYALYSWLVQPTSLIISIIVVAVAAILARLILTS